LSLIKTFYIDEYDDYNKAYLRLEEKIATAKLPAEPGILNALVQRKWGLEGSFVHCEEDPAMTQVVLCIDFADIPLLQRPQRNS